MRIMRQHKRSTGIQPIKKPFKRAPVRAGMIILIILGVDTRADNMVFQLSEDTQHGIGEFKIRGTHVGWMKAQDAVEG